MIAKYFVLLLKKHINLVKKKYFYFCKIALTIPNDIIFMYELRKKDNTKAVILKRTQNVKKNRSHRLTTWTELKRTLLFFRDDIAVYSKIIIKWNELQSIINTIQSCMCVV